MSSCWLIICLLSFDICVSQLWFWIFMLSRVRSRIICSKLDSSKGGNFWSIDLLYSSLFTNFSWSIRSLEMLSRSSARVSIWLFNAMLDIDSISSSYSSLIWYSTLSCKIFSWQSYIWDSFSRRAFKTNALCWAPTFSGGPTAMLNRSITDVGSIAISSKDAISELLS